MPNTPIIHAKEIIRRKYIGDIELENGDYYHIDQITHPTGKYLVAGGACNTGLIPEYARLKEDFESVDEALQELVADLENLDAPSGELLAWHGSMVI